MVSIDAHAAAASQRDPPHLEDLFDDVNRSARTDLALSDGEQSVQEGVFRLSGLETRQGAKIGYSRCSVVADALECHVDEGTASLSSVTRRSSSTTSSGRVTVQSSPPGRTLPRSRSPSNEPPVIGNVIRGRAV